jgi:predicted phage-related endonuclease
MLTEKQKAAREASLGSSDAPIVAGVSPYKSPLELYYQLHGEIPRYTDDESQAQRIGSKLEPMIAELAAEDLGLKIRRSATKKHATHPFMVANLDFEIISNPKGPGLLEIKNRGASRPFESLPDDIALQVAHQLAVVNRDWGIVAVLFGFGTLKTYEVTRDKELEDYLIELEGRFMLRVQRGEPPDHTWTPETVGILKKLYPTDSGQTITLPDQATSLIGQFRQAKDDLERVDQQKAEAEGALKSMMGAASLATVLGYKLSWKSTKASKKFDLNRFKEEHSDLFHQYLKDVPGHRVFRVTTSKELA